MNFKNLRGKQSNCKNAGITLIALIITIIVLIILAGVVISFTAGNQGIIGKAQTSVGKYENAQEDENDKINEYTRLIENIASTRDGQAIPKKIEETNDVTNIGYKAEAQEFRITEDGYYKIECWGAQGGTISGVAGGKGAYTKGIIKLSKGDVLFIYTGECYNGSKETMSFNGGGYSGTEATNGGGATDIRLVDGDWDSFDGLKSRIMVAAGGAGSYYSNSEYSLEGGTAGSLKGRDGKNKIFTTVSGYNVSMESATGATQTSSGNVAKAYNNGSVARQSLQGSFGKGGNGDHAQGSGGGGGYYGGCSGCWGPWASNTASGGSSYISGYEGCNSISRNSTVDNVIHTNSVIHYSDKYFLFAQMIAGDDHMPSYADKTTEIIGNDGNGKVRITKMKVE